MKGLELVLRTWKEGKSINSKIKVGLSLSKLYASDLESMGSK